MVTRENTFYVKYVKCFFDRVIAFCVIVVLLIVYIICGVLIAIDTGFPIIFAQNRVGKGGKVFKIYKFRTMVVNAEKVGPSSTSSNDSRITKSGKFLRKTSLDELPQMLNVLKGEMSFVGYRPDVVRGGDDYSEPKYLLKPGITGLAQVNGRSSLTIEEKKRWENLYPEQVSFICDVKILLKTIVLVLKHSGTN